MAVDELELLKRVNDSFWPDLPGRKEDDVFIHCFLGKNPGKVTEKPHFLSGGKFIGPEEAAIRVSVMERPLGKIAC